MSEEGECQDMTITISNGGSANSAPRRAGIRTEPRRGRARSETSRGAPAPDACARALARARDVHGRLRRRRSGSNAWSRRAAATPTTVGARSRPRHGHKPPSHDQYHGKVMVCYPHKSYVITYVDKTVYRKHVTWKVVWKPGKHGHHGHWKHVKVVTWEPVVIKVRVRTRAITYTEKQISARNWPRPWIRAGYPVPPGGCSAVPTGGGTSEIRLPGGGRRWERRPPSPDSKAPKLQPPRP